MSTEIRVPQLPESVADATLVTWHKQPGDPIRRDENLADLGQRRGERDPGAERHGGDERPDPGGHRGGGCSVHGSAPASGGYGTSGAACTVRPRSDRGLASARSPRGDETRRCGEAGSGRCAG